MLAVSRLSIRNYDKFKSRLDRIGLLKLQNEMAKPMLVGLIGGTDVSDRATGDVT